MSILPFGFQSDRDPNKCAGQRIEGDWFPLQTPSSRRAFYLNKTMQLSKPAHGLRETCLHVMSSCKRFLTFSGMKSENYLEKMCYIKRKNKTKLVKWFFEAYVFKKQKTVCALTVLWNSDRPLSSHGAYLLTLPVFPSYSVYWKVVHI